MTGEVAAFVADDDPLVGIVEWRRPPNNYLDVPLLDQVIRGVADLRSRGCTAVVMRSEGKHFSAGRDFSAPRAPGDTPSDLYERASTLFDSDVPLIAEVQGAAIGAGLGLAAIADFRVAGDRAYFWANFVKLGTHPGFGLSLTLPRIVGAQRAALMFSTGRKVDAATAERWRLVDEVVPEALLHDAAIALASSLTKSSPEALAAVRRTLRPPQMRQSFRDAVRHEAAEQARLRGAGESGPVAS